MTASDERLEELLADEVLWGLDDVEAQELARFGESVEVRRELESLERTGAAIASAILRPAFESPPPRLLERLRRSAEEFVGRPLPPSSGTVPTVVPGGLAVPLVAAGPGAGVQAEPTEAAAPVVRRAPVLAWSGWIAAAAAALVALSVLLDRDGRTARTLEEQLQALVREHPEALRMTWEVGPDGQIVWSPNDQRGFLVVRGLPVNDPRRFQYQLWIFDRTRNTDTPVDGGIFDVGTDGELIVPIDAKIPVRDAFAFAITKEDPGGVVVSAKRPEQIVAAAGL